jgi:hypothetical protein
MALTVGGHWHRWHWRKKYCGRELACECVVTVAIVKTDTPLREQAPSHSFCVTVLLWELRNPVASRFPSTTLAAIRSASAELNPL